MSLPYSIVQNNYNSVQSKGKFVDTVQNTEHGLQMGEMCVVKNLHGRPLDSGAVSLTLLRLYVSFGIIYRLLACPRSASRNCQVLQRDSLTIIERLPSSRIHDNSS